MDTTTQIKGIDVSEHQGLIDWDKVKASGIKFAIIRAGYGRNNIDKQFLNNIKNANRVGIPVGIYWFSYAYSDAMAAAEAAYCVAAIKDYRIELPVVFDLEGDTVENARKHGVTMGKELVSSMTSTFCMAIEQAGYYSMMYTNPDYLSRMVDPALLQRFALWLACYPSKADLNKPPRDCLIWQYSSKGKIVGIAGNVDTNCMYVDVMTKIKELGLNHLSSAPVTPPVEPAKPEPWYAAAQAYVISKGISDGSNPEATATRAEVWQMLYNAKEDK